MSKIKLSNSFVKGLCKLALNEDLFPSGDITSNLLDSTSYKKVKLISNQKLLSSLPSCQYHSI